MKSPFSSRLVKVVRLGSGSDMGHVLRRRRGVAVLEGMRYAWRKWAYVELCFYCILRPK